MTSLIGADQTLTVGELAQVLRWTLDETFPSGVWVTGEIDTLSRPRSGHVYFDLVERPEDAEPGAPPDAARSASYCSAPTRSVSTTRSGGTATPSAWPTG